MTRNESIKTTVEKNRRATLAAVERSRSRPRASLCGPRPVDMRTRPPVVHPDGWGLSGAVRRASVSRHGREGVDALPLSAAGRQVPADADAEHWLGSVHRLDVR